MCDQVRSSLNNANLELSAPQKLLLLLHPRPKRTRKLISLLKPRFVNSGCHSCIGVIYPCMQATICMFRSRFDHAQLWLDNSAKCRMGIKDCDLRFCTLQCLETGDVFLHFLSWVLKDCMAMLRNDSPFTTKRAVTFILRKGMELAPTPIVPKFVSEHIKKNTKAQIVLRNIAAVRWCEECRLVNDKLWWCGGCYKVSYCSVHCQKINWAGHKNVCPRN